MPGTSVARGRAAVSSQGSTTNLPRTHELFPSFQTRTRDDESPQRRKAGAYVGQTPKLSNTNSEGNKPHSDRRSGQSHRQNRCDRSARIRNLVDQIPVAPADWRASVFGCGSVRMGVLPRDEGIVAGHGARSVGATYWLSHGADGTRDSG